MKNFILLYVEKYTNRLVPARTSCRKQIDEIYNNAIQKLREMIGDNLIWLSFDETTDSDGRNIGKNYFLSTSTCI